MADTTLREYLGLNKVFCITGIPEQYAKSKLAKGLPFTDRETTIVAVYAQILGYSAKNGFNPSEKYKSVLEALASPVVFNSNKNDISIHFENSSHSNKLVIPSILIDSIPPKDDHPSHKSLSLPARLVVGAMMTKGIDGESDFWKSYSKVADFYLGWAKKSIDIIA